MPTVAAAWLHWVLVDEPGRMMTLADGSDCVLALRDQAVQLAPGGAG